MKDGKFNAGDIYNLLYERYKDGREFLCAREVADGTGWATRRLDFVACDCYASKGWGIYAFEVKISKSDLRNELFDPTKHNIFFDNIDYFSIVAPDYVLDAEYVKLIPKQWGIIKAVAGKAEGEPNKLVTYRKPLALHDEKNYNLSKDLVFCLMRRLRDDPSCKQTEQEIRNAEYKRGYDDGKRWCAQSDYEKLYEKVNAENKIYRDALSALGVTRSWYDADSKLVEEAKKRAIVIKKHEKAYSALDSMEYYIKKLGNCMEDLKGVSAPVLKVKEDADNNNDDSTAKILDF
jgi:hypothetical protein